MATICRNAAVVDLRWLRFSGWFAWLTWLFVHIVSIIEFDNRLLVMSQWAWNFFTQPLGAMITGEDPPTLESRPPDR